MYCVYERHYLNSMTGNRIEVDEDAAPDIYLNQGLQNCHDHNRDYWLMKRLVKASMIRRGLIRPDPPPFGY